MALPKTLSIENALRLTEPEKIKEEIKARTELKSMMVGSLYPNVIANQIDLLRKLYTKLTGKFDY